VLVVFQEPTEPLTTLKQAFTLTTGTRRWKEEDIPLALMIALVMIVIYILVERMPQGAFTK
jgi:hypothetical protein